MMSIKREYFTMLDIKSQDKNKFIKNLQKTVLESTWGRRDFKNGQDVWKLAYEDFFTIKPEKDESLINY